MIEENKEKRTFILSLTTDAQSQIHHGNMDKALECYDKILKKYSKEPIALYGKAMTYYEFGLYEKAFEIFNAILLDNPEHIDALYARGTLHRTMNRPKESLEDLEKVLLLDKDYHIAWLAKGFTLLDLDSFEESISCFDNAIKLGNKDSAFIGKGHAYRKMNRFKDAQKNYQYVLAIDPYDAEALFGLGLIEFQQNSLKKAEDYLIKSVIQEEENIEAWETLALIFKRNNDTKREKVALEKVEEITRA